MSDLDVTVGTKLRRGYEARLEENDGGNGPQYMYWCRGTPFHIPLPLSPFLIRQEVAPIQTCELTRTSDIPIRFRDSEFLK